MTNQEIREVVRNVGTFCMARPPAGLLDLRVTADLMARPIPADRFGVQKYVAWVDSGCLVVAIPTREACDVASRLGDQDEGICVLVSPGASRLWLGPEACLGWLEGLLAAQAAVEAGGEEYLTWAREQAPGEQFG
jgi:hypothetical protein